MAYSSRYGRRPQELASKSSHSHIINDETVKAFLGECDYPKDKDEILINPTLVVDVQFPKANTIANIIAVDGGYSTIPVKKTFPSSSLTFFQFGTLLLKTKDLEDLQVQPFISREAMAKLNEIDRDKLAFPTKNISLRKHRSLKESARWTLHDFFLKKDPKDNLAKTLHWFLYRLYDKDHKESTHTLSHCPECDEETELLRDNFDHRFVYKCPHCTLDIFITDVFRLHEVIDDEVGASGVLGYLTNVIEHFCIIHTIRNILRIKPSMMDSFLFIKDGPLGFFGQTANMHKLMRHLCRFLFQNYKLYLAGLEKSGAFVEHADEIATLLKPGQALLLDNKHIYSFILPGPPNNPEPYGSTSYYSSKLIFKSMEGRMHVITLPVLDREVVLHPTVSSFPNLELILWNIEMLRCDMYDNAILPVALANKLISLSSHPSANLLEKFAKSSIP